MEYNIQVAAHKIAPVARLLGESGDDQELASALLQRLWDLMTSVGFPTGLDPAVVTDEELPVLVEQCTKVVNYKLNMREAPPDELERLYRRARGEG
jgi:alcohol dehydrogenase class IV